MELAHGTGVFTNCKASVVEKSVNFAGQIWKPSRKLAFVVAEFCHSLPFSNSKGRCFTAATLANSAPTAVLHGFNFNHMLEFYEASRDRYCGAIAAVECAAKADAMALEQAGKSVAMSVLFAMWRKAAGVEEALEEIASDTAKASRGEAVTPRWKTSMECEWPMIESALYDGKNFITWADASEEMHACVTPDEVRPYKGVKMLLAMAGMDGTVNFTGGGLTKYPADENAAIAQVAANDKRKIVVALGWPEYAQAVASSRDETAAKAWSTEDAPDSLFAYVPPEAKGKDGKKSLRKLPLASVEKKGLDPAILRNAMARFPQTDLPAAAKAGVKAKIMAAMRKWNAAHPGEMIEMMASDDTASLVIGQTGEAAGHAHNVLRNLTVAVANGHLHCWTVLDVDPETGAIEGVTSPHWDGTEEHQHDIMLGGARSAATAVAAPVVSSTERTEEGPMKINDIVRLLRERANAVAGKDDPLAKDMTAWAGAMEAELAAASAANAVEETIAARIKSGDLVPKDVHAKAVADATTAGTAAGKKEVEDRIAAEKKAAEVTASRLKAVADAKLQPDFMLRKDTTIASVVASIPATEAGDQDFAAKLEEWVNLSKATGQARASAGSETGSTIPPTAGGGNGAAPVVAAHVYG